MFNLTFSFQQWSIFPSINSRHNLIDFSKWDELNIAIGCCDVLLTFCDILCSVYVTCHVSEPDMKHDNIAPMWPNLPGPNQSALLQPHDQSEASHFFAHVEVSGNLQNIGSGKILRMFPFSVTARFPLVRYWQCCHLIGLKWFPPSYQHLICTSDLADKLQINLAITKIYGTIQPSRICYKATLYVE